MTFSPFRSSRLINVLVTEVCEGEGTEEDPCRLVKYFALPTGEIISKTDPNRDDFSEYDYPRGK